MLGIFKPKDKPADSIVGIAEKNLTSPVTSSVTGSVNGTVNGAVNAASVSSSKSSSPVSTPLISESSSIANNSLNPPKNLPELAKDLYEENAKPAENNELKKEASKLYPNNAFATSGISNNFNNSNNISAENLVSKNEAGVGGTVDKGINISEPSKNAVPNLDLNLIKGLDDSSNRNNRNLVQDYARDYVPSNTQKYTPDNLYNAYLLERQRGMNVLPELSTLSNLQKTFNDLQISENRMLSSSNIVNYRSSNLFSDIIAALLAEGKNELVYRLLSTNMHDTLESYYSGLDNNTQRKLSELRDLETAWNYMNKKNDALRFLINGMDKELDFKATELKNTLITSKSRDNSTINPFVSELTGRYNSNNNLSANNSSLSTNNYSNTDGSNNISVNDLSSGNLNISNLNNASKRVNEDIFQLIKNSYDKTADHESRYFYALDGKVLKSLPELLHALIEMSDSVFYSHVTDQKNDFANWISDVLEMKQLASKIRFFRKRIDLIQYLQTLMEKM